ncbi:hypothetical protein LAZ67_3002431 [Cordylochernes scorpioides]|uniref:Transposase n=1 Tax=Cordylochernes scorpioides TaxID=51811 RepID=A0ABY6KAN7_9ARAC|nr:hypothetical protein LAZ67_3002431 [Cordylochernes scorpioides]
MDDNARPHRALMVDKYLESEGIQKMDWPARSQDLNLIEHVWHALGSRIESHEKLSKTQVYFWYKRFKDGRKSIADDLRSGRSLTSTTDRNIGHVRDLIVAHRKVTIDNISEILGISYGCSQKCNLNLTDQQRGTRLSIF